MIDGLFTLICLFFLAAASQRSHINRRAIAVYAALNIIHLVFLSDLSWLPYYVTAALFDLLIMILIFGLSDVITRKVFLLLVICFASAWVNFAGFAISENVFLVKCYNLTMYMLYGLALILMFYHFDTDKNDARYKPTVFGRVHRFLAGFRARFPHSG